MKQHKNILHLLSQTMLNVSHNDLFHSLFAPLETKEHDPTNFWGGTYSTGTYSNGTPSYNDSQHTLETYHNQSPSSHNEDTPELMQHTIHSADSIEKKSLMTEAFRSLANLEIHKASNFFKNARLNDVEDKELEVLYSTTAYWINKLQNVQRIDASIQKGDTLIFFWNEFIHKQEQYKRNKTNVALTPSHTDRFKSFVFTLAHTCYKHALQKQPSLKSEFDFRLKMYRCLKMLKEYQEAMVLIQGMCSAYPDSALLYSELADCYYLTKHTNNAKLIFREIFFTHPHEINIEQLETPFIQTLAHTIQSEMKYSDQCINHWIPIYGYINHTFNITRELKPIEVHTLQNDISNIEAKLSDHKALGNDDILVVLPALLNRYFWLIEYYKKTHTDDNEKQSHIQILFDKIKKHDPHIHSLLTKI